MKIEIFPLEKVLFDGIPICLGMERAVVENIIGKGQFIGNRYYYCNNDLALEYGENDTVEFIEFLGGEEGSLQPMIYGVPVFRTNADELVELLTQKNGGEISDSDNGYSYSFGTISVGVWRGITPADVQEMIEEMRADGIPTENNEDLEADKRRANHWATVGVGVAGYYQR